MQFIGHCPACAARIEFGPLQPALLGTCTACGAGYMVLVPELGTTSSEAEPAQELELELVAHAAGNLGQHAEKTPRRSWLVERGLQGPVRYALYAFGLLCVCTLAAGLLSLVAPAAAERAWILVFSFLGLPLLVMPVALGFSALAVRFFVARGAVLPPSTYWRSLLALSLGALVLAFGEYLVGTGVAPVFGHGWLAYAVAFVASGALAGWVTVRLAPQQPYRHAVGAGLVFALGLALVVLPFNREAALVALTYAIYIPTLLLGAWLGARIGPGPAGPGAAA